MIQDPYWKVTWQQFRRNDLGCLGLGIVALFCLVGIYAPFLAASKPLVVFYDGHWYFPLFRYLIYSGYYTKRLDIFFNLLIFTLPLFLVGLFSHGYFRRIILGAACLIQFTGFFYFAFGTPHNPAANKKLIQEKFLSGEKLTWADELMYMTPYAKLNLLIRYRQRWEQQKHLLEYAQAYPEAFLPTLWQIEENHTKEAIEREKKILKTTQNDSLRKQAAARLAYINDKNEWLRTESQRLHYEVMPLLRPFHWEDDAAGDQKLNQSIGWWESTRINRKDLVAALVFGVRISLVVGLTSVGLALLIGVPIGALAGFYGGRIDIVVCRLLEIWESMPSFFMLLMVLAITQSKSIFLVIAVIALFGWTGFSRYIRGEFFKQRNLSYVESCYALGFNDTYIMFRHILPNAIPPILTLLPFAVMGAITSEAGLSFLGLGEEQSASWGVLMDEGRSAFPAESYLLWPPAILLTILLISIALVGDALRDAIDPKMHNVDYSLKK